MLDAALRLFRRGGYDATTMRDVAAAAGLSLGAAYHYFPSKQAIVLAYFARKQDEHDSLVGQRLASLTSRGLAARAGAVLHMTIDSLAADRKLLGALLGTVVDPASPLTPFGARLAGIRGRSIARFADAVAGADPPPPPDLAPVLPTALWGLMMACILHLLHDRSAAGRKTHALADRALEVVDDLVGFAALPVLAGTRAKVRRLVESLGAR